MPDRSSKRNLILLMAATLLAPPAIVAAGSDATGTALFRRHVRPTLEARCFHCHGGRKTRSGFDMTTRETLLRGGDSGPAVVPGDASASLLYKLITHRQQPAMPQRAEQLPEETIAQIAAWIDAAAPYDGALRKTKLAPAGDVEPPGQDHWAFKPPAHVTPPAVRDRDWVRNPIDAFIAAGHEARKLQRSPPAHPRVLLRRVYLDLIGLPPSPAQLDAFLADPSTDAYEHTVDELLASPRYGERWGRHWMDVWRYSDWYGRRALNDVRYSQPHIWRWRDWIIESLNEDKGYDRMVMEMLAGDELAPTDPRTVRATGYLARNWYKFNRNSWLQDTVEHTSMGFLGLTMKCARCHEHKYDPIPQEDYYRLRAFFEPYDVRTDRVPGELDVKKAGIARVIDAKLDAPTYRFIRGNETDPDERNPQTAGVPELFGEIALKIESVPLPVEAYYPDLRPFVREQMIGDAEAKLRTSESALAQARTKLSDSKQRALAAAEATDGNEKPPTDDKAREAEAAVELAERVRATAQGELASLKARIAADVAAHFGPNGADTTALSAEAARAERTAAVHRAEEELLRQQQALTQAQAAIKPDDEKTEQAATAAEKKVKDAGAALDSAKAALEEPGIEYTSIGSAYPKFSTGRRSALARWIASKDNPLTARVAVNHIWMRHFAEPLVPTVFNFGLGGKPPSHPQLLDWLAVRFMNAGWSMKAIHRLIVTSSTYRMQSTTAGAHAANMRIDPGNRYLWRMNTRRMEAEIVRDSALHVAGRLDAAMGGPELDPALGQTSGRRSLYFLHAPGARMTFLELFDAPSPNECYRRRESVVPQQALALCNSPLSWELARELARSMPSTDEAGFIASAFERILGRGPSAAEARTCTVFLNDQAELLSKPDRLTAFTAGREARFKPAADPAARARENLVHVLLNHNDFVTIR